MTEKKNEKYFHMITNTLLVKFKIKNRNTQLTNTDVFLVHFLHNL